jgi:hypothetical protein
VLLVTSKVYCVVIVGDTVIAVLLLFIILEPFSIVLPLIVTIAPLVNAGVIVVELPLAIV